jgi:hypothetical protein
VCAPSSVYPRGTAGAARCCATVRSPGRRDHDRGRRSGRPGSATGASGAHRRPSAAPATRPATVRAPRCRTAGRAPAAAGARDRSALLGDPDHLVQGEDGQLALPPPRRARRATLVLRPRAAASRVCRTIAATARRLRESEVMRYQRRADARTEQAFELAPRAPAGRLPRPASGERATLHGLDLQGGWYAVTSTWSPAPSPGARTQCHSTWRPNAKRRQSSFSSGNGSGRPAGHPARHGWVQHQVGPTAVAAARQRDGGGTSRPDPNAVRAGSSTSTNESATWRGSSSYCISSSTAE